MQQAEQHRALSYQQTERGEFIYDAQAKREIQAMQQGVA
jgi:hypothetical protein